MQKYEAILEFLYQQLPMYQRVGSIAYKKDLHNILAITQLLNYPQNKLVCIHVAGTNGKGSTCHGLASVLQEAGYKVGLYTSPHLKDFRERIRINGNMIPRQEVIDFVTNYQSIFSEIRPSFFEWTFALALYYFAQQQVDIAIIETGLGGRLDSTNIVHPILSIITNISWDHQAILGDTLPKIAFEKAGIIKEKTAVIIGQTQAEVVAVFQEEAQKKQAPLIFADQQQDKNYTSDLQGNYQRHNLKTIVAAVRFLQKNGWSISEHHLVKGLQQIKKNTGLMGRWQVLSQQPLTITDTAHNLAGITLLLQQLQSFSFAQLHIVLALLADKDISAILAILPTNAIYYFSQANVPRALSAELLQTRAAQFNLQGKNYASITLALQTAQAYAAPDDLIFVGGSIFTVAEVV